MKVLRRRHKGKLRKPIFLSRKWKRRKKVWRGIFWLALLGLAALPSVHWANLLLYRKQLQTSQSFLLPFPLTKLGDRVAIVSPHPDDETLGCAGLIQRLLQRGVMPLVIVFTNGDGFDASIHLKLHEVQINPKDRAEYAKNAPSGNFGGDAETWVDFRASCLFGLFRKDACSRLAAERQR